MTKYFLFMILSASVVLLLFTAFPAASADRGNRVSEAIDQGVCVYEKPGFEGRSQCWSANTDISDLSFGDWKDKISSVRVFGHARLVGYKDTDFHGDRIIIDHDILDLSTLPMPRAGNWNHVIRSVAIQLEP